MKISELIKELQAVLEEHGDTGNASPPFVAIRTS
jgi:hypothetical protein